jgi:hypothetical protein
MQLSYLQALLGNEGKINNILITHQGDALHGEKHTDETISGLEPLLEGSGLKAEPVKQDALKAADEAGSSFASIFLLFGLEGASEAWAACPCSIWPNPVTPGFSYDNPNPIEMGLKFRSARRATSPVSVSSRPPERRVPTWGASGRCASSPASAAQKKPTSASNTSSNTDKQD